MKTLNSSDFIDISSIDPSIVIDLRYATNDNFTGGVLYPVNSKAYLRRLIAESLAKANLTFRQHGYLIKVWDAYRPFAIQEKFWEVYPDENYIAKPIRDGNKLIDGSKHSRGTAVDLTLIDIHTNKNIEMPSEFDDFSKKAHRDYASCSIKASKNRDLLEKVMQDHGFVGWFNEWWHFDWHDSKSYQLSDLPMNEIV